MVDAPTLADAASTLGGAWNKFVGAGRALGSYTGLGRGGVPDAPTPLPASNQSMPATTGFQPAPTTQAGATAARSGFYTPGASVDPEFVRGFQDFPVDPTHPNAAGHAAAFTATAHPGEVSAQEMVRRTAGMTPYQMAQLRASYAPLISPTQQITSELLAGEDARYMSRVGAMRAGKTFLSADGKTPLTPDDEFLASQARKLAIIQANQMMNMNAAAAAQAATGSNAGTPLGFSRGGMVPVKR